MKLSDLLKQYRQENDLSQRDFARKCSLSHGTISLIERETNPQTGKEMSQDMDTYKKLADGMGLTVQELFEKLDVDAAVVAPPRRLYAQDAMPKTDYRQQIERDLGIPEFKDASIADQVEGILSLWEATKPESRKIVIRLLNKLTDMEGKP